MSEKKTAIYNFSGGKGIRPVVNERELNKLKKFANNNGLDVDTIYCDNSLKESEHEELDRFIREKEEYDKLVIKDLYHLSGSTATCMRIVRTLNEAGIQIYTMKDGFFKYTEAPVDKSLRIAIYFKDHLCGHKSAEVQEKIYRLYVETKTKWKIVDIYREEKWRKNNNCQEELYRLLDNQEKYDLLLVDGFNTINVKTLQFRKLRKLLKMDIFSLYDGFLKYEEREEK